MMLPGVECARKRRLHQSRGGGYDSTTIRSFCLYTRNLKSTTSSLVPSLLQERSMRQTYPDEKLGRSAREAKRRLDEKFTASMKSENQLNNHKTKSFFRGLFHQLRS
ncbi:uncharacterized protein LOC123923190 [Trifolium pratense]|uniref:uncharacterized protein LOC123923190 n=1 Tax=Trifolium pratense TaxID=57577 RepID=UPI001E696BF2|nr:uncharacterized protein LOC123923190 [Trifolium pratense]